MKHLSPQTHRSNKKRKERETQEHQTECIAMTRPMNLMKVKYQPKKTPTDKKRKKAGQRERRGNHPIPTSTLNNMNNANYDLENQNILQWNCNGCQHHYNELKLLLTKYNPIYVCLQETHLSPNSSFKLNGFSVFRKDVNPVRRARGGVCICVKENIPAKEHTLNTNVQAIAIQIQYPFKLTICNIYLPSFNWHKNDLVQLFNQLPPPYLVVGDFNAHNPLWGSARLDLPGTIIEEILNELDLVILNNGEGTFLNSRSNNFSAIDLSFCSANVAPKLGWECLNNQSFSDHFPIKINFAGCISSETYPNKYILERADWDLFHRHLQHFRLSDDDINVMVEEISKAIISAADASIPKKGTPTRKRCLGGTKKLPERYLLKSMLSMCLNDILPQTI